MQCLLCYTFPINKRSVNSRVVILANIAYVSKMKRIRIEKMILANEQAKGNSMSQGDNVSHIWTSGQKKARIQVL